MSEQPQNIQCFNAAARAVLVQLYSEFPKPVMLQSQPLMKSLPEYCESRWPTSVNGDNFVAATIRFLHDEGYLRISGEVNSRTTSFSNVVLTSRGFAALNQPLDSLTEAGETIGQALRRNLSIADIGTAIMGVMTVMGR